MKGINADLTIGIDITPARRLPENKEKSFEGPSPKGSFDIAPEIASKMLSAPINVNGRPNSDVVRRVLNARDVTQRPRNMFTIDFGVDTSEIEAAYYEAPFKYVVDNVKPERIKNKMRRRAEFWWIYGSPASRMRQAIAGLSRYIATPRVSKHRIFVWVDVGILCNDTTDIFAFEDDFTFGILHSRIHELWARRMGTQLREVESGFRYTPTTCFETFPFPEPTDAQRTSISAAAVRLNERREGWLNPPDATEAQLKQRTLTNLYNERPTWLANAHDALDAAVADAYGCPADLTDAQILEMLLALNLQRSQ